MKARETRRRVVVNSRIRCNAGWRDASILNISSRGLGLHASRPPEPASYIEVQRGHHLIIARVVWVDGCRFGVRSQDIIPIETVLGQSELSDAPLKSKAASEFRSLPSGMVRALDRQHETSRVVARCMEFAFVAILGVSAAFLGFGMVTEAIGRPMAELQTALDR